MNKMKNKISFLALFFLSATVAEGSTTAKDGVDYINEYAPVSLFAPVAVATFNPTNQSSFNPDNSNQVTVSSTNTYNPNIKLTTSSGSVYDNSTHSLIANPVSTSGSASTSKVENHVAINAAKNLPGILAAQGPDLRLPDLQINQDDELVKAAKRETEAAYGVALVEREEYTDDGVTAWVEYDPAVLHRGNSDVKSITKGSAPANSPVWHAAPSGAAKKISPATLMRVALKLINKRFADVVAVYNDPSMNQFSIEVHGVGSGASSNRAISTVDPVSSAVQAFSLVLNSNRSRTSERIRMELSGTILTR